VRGRLRRFACPCFGILFFLPYSTVASWCNWLTRRPLKAESSGSIPDDATKFSELTLYPSE
jgi:uncharacterized SAM-binding protein YcdF (DUF218 family)